jgi:hypothetical protein
MTYSSSLPAPAGSVETVARQGSAEEVSSSPVMGTARPAKPRPEPAALAVTLAAIGIYVGLRLYGLVAFDLWGGETFLLDGVRMGWSDMMAYLANDMVHPPLSYFLLRLWVAIGGESLLWLKLFAVLPSVAVIVPLVLLCRELRLSRFELNLTLLVAAVNGYLIHYAQEVRMYSLFLFLAMCSGWLFARYFNATVRAGRQLAVLTVVNLLMVYTHYFGWLLVAAQFLTLLIWHRRRVLGFMAANTAVVVLFLPWVLLVARVFAVRGSTLGFIPPPTPGLIAHLYANLNGPIVLGGMFRPTLALFGVAALVWFADVVRRRVPAHERRLFWWLSFCAFVPVALAAVGSRVLPDSFWFDRYFIFVAPYYLLLFAASVHRLRPRWLRLAFAAALLATSSIAGIRDLATNRMAWTSPQVGSRVAWADAAARLAAATAAGDGPARVYVLPIISLGRGTGQWAVHTSLLFHLPPERRETFEFVSIGGGPERLLGRTLEAAFWIAAFQAGSEPAPIPEAALAELGYRREQVLRIGAPGQMLLLARYVRAPDASEPAQHAAAEIGRTADD